MGGEIPLMPKRYPDIDQNDTENIDFWEFFIDSSRLITLAAMNMFPSVQKEVDERFKCQLNRLTQVYALHSEKPSFFDGMQMAAFVFKSEFETIFAYFHKYRKIEIHQDMKDICVEKLGLQDIKEVTELPTRESNKETSLEKSEQEKCTSISIETFLAGFKQFNIDQKEMLEEQSILNMSQTQKKETSDEASF